jgi:hypothetical protein
MIVNTMAKHDAPAAKIISVIVEKHDFKQPFNAWW